MVCENHATLEGTGAMKVRLTEPRLVDRRPDRQSGPSGPYLTTWRGEFEGTPNQWWWEAFAMWAREDLRGICTFRITTGGYEFECGEDQIDDVTEKLVAAAKKATPTAERSRAAATGHRDTRVLLAKAEAAEEEAGRCKLQERMAEKFKSLEQ